MKRLFFLIIFILLSLYLSASRGVVVIIDPGHGGRSGKQDNSCVIKHDGKSYIESGYTYDLSLRLEKILKDSGFVVFKTVKNDKRSISNKKYLLRNREAIFTLDDSKVTSDRIGLNKRSSYANKIYFKYKNSCKVIFISIHFDNIPAKYFGTRFIKERDNTFLNILKTNIKSSGLLSNNPISEIQNGDLKTYGGRSLYVLRANTNTVPVKVLIEVSNLNSPKDLERAKDPKFRNDFAYLIFKSIKQYSNPALISYE